MIDTKRFVRKQNFRIVFIKTYGAFGVSWELQNGKIKIDMSLHAEYTNRLSIIEQFGEYTNGKDYITALLTFENGATANITASRITQARVRTLSVTTDTNYIDMDFINQSINVHSQGRMPFVNQDEIPDWMHYGLKGSVEQLFIPTNQPLQAELNHFINCVNGKEAPRITGEAALEALKVIWTIEEKLGFFAQDNKCLKIAAE